MKNIIHIGTADKFLVDFEAFNSQHFPNYNHKYFLIAAENTNQRNIISGSSWFIFWKMLTSRRMFTAADQICLHGIFDTLTLIYFLINLKQLKRSYWFIWGGDLHVHELRKKSAKIFTKEILRKVIIRRIPHYVTYLFKDFEYATRIYGQKALQRFCILYPSNICKEIPKNHSDKLTILLGNSANPRNRHKELIDLISAKVHEEMKVIIPLSYGDLIYAADIKRYAQLKLKCELKFLDQVLPKAEYYQLLSSVDVACMYHKRQMGMGNTIQLIGSGRRVLFAPDSDAVVSLEHFGFEVERLSEDTSFMHHDLSLKNIELADKIFSTEALKNQLNDIYKGV